MSSADFLILSMQALFALFLKSASVDFVGDARHRACSCSMLPQTLDNAADPVKAALPKGKLFLKNDKFPISRLTRVR